MQVKWEFGLRLVGLDLCGILISAIKHCGQRAEAWGSEKKRRDALRTFGVGLWALTSSSTDVTHRGGRDPPRCRLCTGADFRQERLRQCPPACSSAACDSFGTALPRVAGQRESLGSSRCCHSHHPPDRRLDFTPRLQLGLFSVVEGNKSSLFKNVHLFFNHNVLTWSKFKRRMRFNHEKHSSYLLCPQLLFPSPVVTLPVTHELIQKYLIYHKQMFFLFLTQMLAYFTYVSAVFFIF